MHDKAFLSRNRKEPKRTPQAVKSEGVYRCQNNLLVHPTSMATEREHIKSPLQTEGSLAVFYILEFAF
jgi:hypothetical protein